MLHDDKQATNAFQKDGSCMTCILQPGPTITQLQNLRKGRSSEALDRVLTSQYLIHQRGRGSIASGLLDHDDCGAVAQPDLIAQLLLSNCLYRKHCSRGYV